MLLLPITLYNQNRKARWLWQALDYATGEVLAYVRARPREDTAFLELKALLQPFGFQHFGADGWGRMNGIKGEEQHTIGKRYTQNTTVETFELLRSH